MNAGALCLMMLVAVLAVNFTIAQQSPVGPAASREVTERPVSAADEAKLDAYIQDAMLNEQEPEARSAPDYWQPGYTCADIYTYGWLAYRNCRYYLRYYGRYWD